MLPILLVSKVNFFKIPSLDIKIVLNFLFLSIFASVLYFLMWNKAISIIGSVKTTNYIYFVPIITMVSSDIFLNEKISKLMLLGGALIFLGVYINQSKWIKNIINSSLSRQESCINIDPIKSELKMNERILKSIYKQSDKY